MNTDPHDVAIVTVHGNNPAYDGDFARIYPWPRLQLEQLRRFTPQGYKVLAYGNGIIPEHAAILREYPEVELHVPFKAYSSPQPIWAFRNWLVRKASRRFRYLINMDSDAFPVAADWLPHYLGRLAPSHPVIAVQRLENKGDDFSHTCFTLFTSESWRQHFFDFSTVGVKDAGAGISAHLNEIGLDWHRLVRSNQWNPHPLAAGIYDDRIYHHGAGSRLPVFRQNAAIRKDPAAWRREIELHQGLMDLLFADCDRLVERLRGRREPLAEGEILDRGRRAIQRQRTNAVPQ